MREGEGQICTTKNTGLKIDPVWVNMRPTKKLGYFTQNQWTVSAQCFMIRLFGSLNLILLSGYLSKLIYVHFDPVPRNDLL